MAEYKLNAPLSDADGGAIAFLADRKLVAALRSSRAGLPRIWPVRMSQKL